MSQQNAVPHGSAASSWIYVNLPWRTHDSEARHESQRLWEEYNAWHEGEIARRLPAPPSMEGWDTERVARAVDATPDLSSRECRSEEAFSAFLAIHEDPDVRMLATRRRHRVLVSEIEMTDPEFAQWQRRIDALGEVVRGEQFSTHPMCQPGIALEVCAVDGSTRRVLIGDCSPSGSDLAIPEIADDEVIVRFLDLRPLYTA